MPLVIRDADEEIYARFKAKAALKGLKIGEAISEAMEKWVNEDKLQNPVKAKQQINNFTYRRIISDLRRKFSDKWGIISEGDLLGIFDNKKTALKAIQSSDSVPNLIFFISDKIEPRIMRLGIRRASDD